MGPGSKQKVSEPSRTPGGTWHSPELAFPEPSAGFVWPDARARCHYWIRSMPSAEWQRLIAGQVLHCTFADSDILPSSAGVYVPSPVTWGVVHW